MSKVRPGPPHPLFIPHPEISIEDALVYASELLNCAEQLHDSPKAAGYLMEMAKVMVDRSLECMGPH